MLTAIALTSAVVLSAAVDRLGPDGALGNGAGFLVADDANAAPHLAVSALVLESWAQDPVVLRDPQGHIVSSIVSDQWTTTAAASVGLFDRLELSAKVAGAALGEHASAPVFAALSPRIALKGTIGALGPVAFGARAAVDVAAAQGDVTRVEPALLATFTRPWLRAGVDVGAGVGLDGSARVDYAIGAAIPLVSVFSVDADLFGSYAPGHAPMEGTLAADAKLGSFDVVTGVGGGLIADVGTPHVRAFAALRFAFDPERTASTPTPVTIAKAPAPVASSSIPAAPAPPALVEEPAAAAPPVVAIADDHIELDAEVVLFDIESDTLLPSARPLLDEVARLLAAHSEIERVVVEGHADATGDAGYNQKLSLWRALVVREYLIARGIAPSRLGVLAFGTKKPRAPNDTEAGRKLNRRVEMVITKRVDVDGGAQ